MFAYTHQLLKQANENNMYINLILPPQNTYIYRHKYINYNKPTHLHLANVRRGKFEKNNNRRKTISKNWAL